MADFFSSNRISIGSKTDISIISADI